MASKTKLLSDQNLDLAFKMLDVNGDGRISKQELKDAFLSGNEQDEQLWDQIMLEVDKDGDQHIDREEFYAAMKQKLQDQDDERL